MASPLDLSVDAVGSRPHRMGSVRIIIACGLGNALEWFDFAAYAMFATAIAKNFFPTGNDVTSLLATFAAFAVGFVMRPVGPCYWATMPIKQDARPRYPRRFC